MAIYDTNAQRDALNSNLFASKKKKETRENKETNRASVHVIKSWQCLKLSMELFYILRNRCSIKIYLNRTQQLSSLIFSKLTKQLRYGYLPWEIYFSDFNRYLRYRGYKVKYTLYKLI